MRGNHSILSWAVLAAGAIGVRKAVGFDGLQCGADAPVLGVSRTSAASGEHVTLELAGIGVLKAGGAIPRGARLVTDANGDAVAATGTPANPFGRSLHAAAAGEDVQFLFTR